MQTTVSKYTLPKYLKSLTVLVIVKTAVSITTDGILLIYPCFRVQPWIKLNCAHSLPSSVTSLARSLSGAGTGVTYERGWSLRRKTEKNHHSEDAYVINPLSNGELRPQNQVGDRCGSRKGLPR